MAEAGCLRPELVSSRMQTGGSNVGSLCLCGQSLRVAKFRDSGGQRDELGH